MEFYKFPCPHYMNTFEKTGAGCNKTCCTHLLVNPKPFVSKCCQLDLYPLLDDLLLIGTLYGWWWMCAHVSETQWEGQTEQPMKKQVSYTSICYHKWMPWDRERYLDMTWVLYYPKQVCWWYNEKKLISLASNKQLAVWSALLHSYYQCNNKQNKPGSILVPLLVSPVSSNPSEYIRCSKSTQWELCGNVVCRL